MKATLLCMIVFAMIAIFIGLPILVVSNGEIWEPLVFGAGGELICFFVLLIGIIWDEL